MCGRFLAHVSVAVDEDMMLDSIPEVREYPDVFLDELLALPPHHEINF